MILFASDWDKFPTAEPDFETSNRSYVDLAGLYKSMGVRNHTFHLALVNQALKGVDPFDPELTDEEQLAIGIECRINPWYFFREVCRVPGQSNAPAVPLEANRGNIALFWCFFNHATTFLIQVRQTGKSISSDMLSTYLLNIRCQDTDINLLTKDETLRKNNMKRLKDIDYELPGYLRQRTKNDIANNEEMHIKSLNNRFMIHVPQASPKDAEKIGRGLTSPIMFVDEGPFQRHIATAVPAAFAASTAARQRAASVDGIYGNIFTTTAGKKDDRDGAYIFGILQQCFSWTEALFDCEDFADFKKMVCANSGFSEVPYINITLNHHQVGKDDQWLRETLQNLPGIEPDAADRDFFNRWTSGSQSSPLSVELLEEIRQGQMDPVALDVSKINRYTVRWFIPQDQIQRRMTSSHFVMSIDSSEASGSDEISFHIKDAYTGEVVCAGNFNETNIITFSEWLADWFTRFENFCLIIERKSTGSTIIDHLLLILPALGIDPFKRIFNRVVQESDMYPERFREVMNTPMGRRNQQFYTQHKKAFGFSTAGAGQYARNELYGSVLVNCARQTGRLIRDKKTIDQLTSLEIRNGRVDHPEGGHDDMVIALLLGHWFLTHGRNLVFYGFDVTRILSATRVSKPRSALELVMAQKQEALKLEVEGLVEQLAREQNDFIVMKLEHRLKHLNNQMSFEDQELFSIEELIKKTKEKKKEGYAKRVANYSGHGASHHDQLQQKMRVAYAWKDPNSIRFG